MTISHVQLVSVPVRDQETAKRFYVNEFGSPATLTSRHHLVPRRARRGR